MRITLLSTSDRSGGAAIACMRMAHALEEHGHTVRVLVMERKGTDDLARLSHPGRAKLDGYLRHVQYAVESRTLFHREQPFSGSPWWTRDLSDHPDIREADVIQLHWINQGFLGPRDLRELFALKKPVVWHLHDFWAFTGGCHYPGACQAFERSCGSCPALRHPAPRDRSAQQWQDKATLFREHPPTLVGASAWLADQARRSSLGQLARVTHIPNPIDVRVFHPAPSRQDARRTLGIPEGNRYLLFAAMNTADTRKGFSELRDALKLAANDLAGTELLVAGKAHPDLLRSLPLPVRPLGSLGEAGMRTAYQAADAFVIPSLEENLPNTVLESLACGTPVAGFRTGGIPEMVDEGRNGNLAATGDVAGLAHAVRAILLHPDPQQLAVGAWDKIREGFLPEQVASAYTDLFRTLLAERRS
jgi:glycosyltransferase involved in cell wall biosynthesis